MQKNGKVKLIFNTCCLCVSRLSAVIEKFNTPPGSPSSCLPDIHGCNSCHNNREGSAYLGSEFDIRFNSIWKCLSDFTLVSTEAHNPYFTLIILKEPSYKKYWALAISIIYSLTHVNNAAICRHSPAWTSTNRKSTSSSSPKQRDNISSIWHLELNHLQQFAQELYFNFKKSNTFHKQALLVITTGKIKWVI